MNVTTVIYMFSVVVWVKVVFRKTVDGDTFRLPERQSSSESSEESSSDDGIYASGLGLDWSVLS